MKTRQLLFCAFFAALTVVGAYIRIPLGYAIITMQFFFAALAGVMLGAKWGAASQLLYLTLGFIGLPVFGAGGGLGYLLQPTCGFVLALPLCAALIGAMTKKSASRGRVVLACALALALLYALGIVYLYAVFRFYLRQEMSFARIFALYLLPYIPGDCAKAVLCTLLGERLRRQVNLREM